MDPYKVLGVTPQTSDDDVKRAYRELARKYHPDNYVNNPLADLAETRMKEINAYFRKHATALGCPGLSDEDAAKLDRRVQEGYSWEKQPYPSYVLSGNTAEMRRLRQRIEEVSRTQSTEYVGWDFPGGRAEADKEDNRLRLYFDEKPSEEQRSKLKCNGFKWAPSVGAWQRQLNDNAIHAAARMDFLRPESGENPTAIQPKRPVKNAPERG